MVPRLAHNQQADSSILSPATNFKLLPRPVLTPFRSGRWVP
jgi:hypothetical protein